MKLSQGLALSLALLTGLSWAVAPATAQEAPAPASQVSTSPATSAASTPASAPGVASNASTTEQTAPATSGGSSTSAAPSPTDVPTLDPVTDSAPTPATAEQASEQTVNQAPAAPAAAAETPVAAAAANPTYTVHWRGAIGQRYQADGGLTKAIYGTPTSNEQCGFMHNSCYQDFERGTLVWSPSTGTRLLYGAIRSTWKAAGGMTSGYGIPSTEEIARSGGQAVEQRFLTPAGRAGAIYWTNWGTGTHYVNLGGAIGGLWNRMGAAGSSYGYPTSDEQCGFIHNSCYQDFQHGTVVWSPGYGAHGIFGAIRSTWKAAGGMKSSYGIPVSGEISHHNGQAAEQLFYSPTRQDGGIYWTAWGTGTHYVYFGGAIGSYWASNGNFRAGGVDTPRRYGFPTSAETCSNGRCYQKYEFGVITWDNYGGGTHGHQAQKCHALNNGRSKYSAQGARQVALALAPRYSAYRNDPVGSHGMFYSCQNTHGMYTLKWSTPAAFGESGFLAPWKRIRDYETGELLPAGVTGNTAGAYSPTGSFSLSTPFGVANPGSGFSDYKTINRNSRWGGDRNTWYYNRYIENGALGYPNENMWNYMTRGDYRQGLMINYNRNLDGSVPSGTAGFAIMLHTIPYSGAAASVAAYQSWGCIAIAPDRMTQFLREGRDADRIIMGVESEVMNW